MSDEQPSSELDLTGLMQDGLRELIELVGSSGVTEIKIQRGETKLHIKSSAADTPTAAVAALPDGSTTPPDTPTLPKSTAAVPVVSPLVGIFYSAARPGAEPFVQPGGHVEAGQTVGVIEAMKIMNEIESEVTGQILEILVQNSQAVEYGQTLMLVDTSARPSAPSLGA